MIIALAADHAGFHLKERIKTLLDSLQIEYKDFGTYSNESCDYPDFGIRAAKAISKGECDRGILICGTGIGMSITANKVKGVRAALCTSVPMAEISRRHNDANVLVMGGRTTEEALALQMVEIWLKTGFDGGRHQRRVEKIHRLTGM